MDRPASALRQRTTSFNPEAAAFNPVYKDVEAAPATSPTPADDTSSVFQMAPMFNCEHSASMLNLP